MVGSEYQFGITLLLHKQARKSPRTEGKDVLTQNNVFPTLCSHSGKLGSINFMNGVMGIANAQRTLNYIRVITEFINQPQYRNVVPMFGIINEAQANVIGVDNIRALWVQEIQSKV